MPRRTDCAVGLTESEKSAGTVVTVTLAVPLTLPLVAVTVKEPAVEPAVNKPAVLMVPPPLTVQVNVGCGLTGWPNWSRPVAVNCCVPPVCTDALAGATVIVVRTGGAVTVTLAVPLTLPLAAVPVKGPPAVEPAVNKPAASIVPPPVTDHVNVGCGLIGLPNWSRPVAVNC